MFYYNRIRFASFFFFFWLVCLYFSHVNSNLKFLFFSFCCFFVQKIHFQYFVDFSLFCANTKLFCLTSIDRFAILPNKFIFFNFFSCFCFIWKRLWQQKLFLYTVYFVCSSSSSWIETIFCLMFESIKCNWCPNVDDDWPNNKFFMFSSKRKTYTSYFVNWWLSIQAAVDDCFWLIFVNLFPSVTDYADQCASMYACVSPRLVRRITQRITNFKWEFTISFKASLNWNAKQKGSF